jgi:hypothetical protein
MRKLAFIMCIIRKRRFFISYGHIVSNIQEILQRVREERNILLTIKRRNVNWIGHILHRNCLLKHVIEGKIA